MIRQSGHSISSAEGCAIKRRVVSSSIESCESRDYGGCIRFRVRSNSPTAGGSCVAATSLLHFSLCCRHSANTAPTTESCSPFIPRSNSFGTRSFVVYTNHKPLVFAFKQKPEKSTPRQFRYLDFISQFTTDMSAEKTTKWQTPYLA